MEIDYQKLGFKCGLEIHQQLEGKKLFCNCLTLNSDAEADVKFERRLRAVAGETGKIDIAAKHEMEKGRKIIYEADSADTCLVECDEEPPHELNIEALETTLKAALLFNAKVVDEIQVMRKTVVDGSNVSGFQRTALVAQDGFIETSQGKVVIPTICLEEEAAQKLEDGNNFVRYRLDRLGIPLIEIATNAGIKSPEHAKEVAAYIGMVLRSVGVKRGLGTIRQDVNVSIKDGARTEIKGFQDLRSIPKVIEYEINRQLNAINQNKKLNEEVRKAEPDFTTSFLRPMPGADRLYPETDVVHVKVEKNYVENLKKQLPKDKNSLVIDAGSLVTTYSVFENGVLKNSLMSLKGGKSLISNMAKKYQAQESELIDQKEKNSFDKIYLPEVRNFVRETLTEGQKFLAKANISDVFITGEFLNLPDFFETAKKTFPNQCVSFGDPRIGLDIDYEKFLPLDKKAGTIPYSIYFTESIGLALKGLGQTINDGMNLLPDKLRDSFASKKTSFAIGFFSVLLTVLTLVALRMKKSHLADSFA